MKKLDYFRLFVFLFIIILASLYELRKDHIKYNAEQTNAELKMELVQSNR